MNSPTTLARRKNRIRTLAGDFLEICGFIFRLFRAVIRAIVLGVLVKLGLRARRVHISELKFPVVVVHPGEQPFVEIYALDLKRVSRRSRRTPVEQALIIDSDFNLFRQSNIRCTENEFGQIFRILVPQADALPYKFDLTRCGASGREAAIAALMACPSYPADAKDVEQMRREIADQHSMAGIIALWRRDAPKAAELSDTGEERPPGFNG